MIKNYTKYHFDKFTKTLYCGTASIPFKLILFFRINLPQIVFNESVNQNL